MFAIIIFAILIAVVVVANAYQTRELRDALLETTEALPNGAATVVSDPLQIHSAEDGTGQFHGAELVITIPALSTTLLPDTQTITYTIESDTTSAFSSATTISRSVVQTGAGGAGAAATELRIGIPSDVEPYVRAKAVKTGAADASGASMTFSVKV